MMSARNRHTFRDDRNEQCSDIKRAEPPLVIEVCPHAPDSLNSLLPIFGYAYPKMVPRNEARVNFEGGLRTPCALIFF